MDSITQPLPQQAAWLKKKTAADRKPIPAARLPVGQAYQSYRQGEWAEPPKIPTPTAMPAPRKTPPPLTTRALTIVPALLGFLVLDVTLVSLTVANSVAIGLAADPLSKSVFIANEIVLTGIDIFVAYLHVSYAHWVVTGQGIRQSSDLTDWELRP